MNLTSTLKRAERLQKSAEKRIGGYFCGLIRGRAVGQRYRFASYDVQIKVAWNFMMRIFSIVRHMFRQTDQLLSVPMDSRILIRKHFKRHI